ncbi:MAG: type II methionyl aminopeptidase [Candidatus Thorarchaeota archaeon]
MTDAPHPSHVKSGKIAARVLKEIGPEISPGASVLRICNLAEKKILDYGGQPAFPCNVNVNHVAAHNTAPVDDKSRIPDFGLVKVDIGVHIDGYIADTAVTIDVDGTLEGFVAATDDALEEAIQLLRPGVSLGEIGKQIQKVITAYGLRPIDNLSGHNLKRYRLHGGKTVPNTKRRTPDIVEAGEYYAIEPFATSGIGKVMDTDFVYILENTGKEMELKGTTEKLRKHLLDRYGPLPFTSRWVGASKGVDVVEEIRELLKVKAIKAHHVQVEKKGRPVSQSEHTVFVSESDVTVLTRPD